MAVAVARTLEHVRDHRLALWVVGAAATIVAISGGLIGSYRYLDNYWLYRGFAPPKDPAFVSSKGRLVRFELASAALGGRRQPVDVYLPPGYDSHPREHYPVFYLLHGFPGVPASYFRAGGSAWWRTSSRQAEDPSGHPRHAVRLHRRVHRQGVG